MIEGRSVLALITARGGSKGLPGKNIRPVIGRPLIQWTIDAAHGSRHIDRLILSSDDQEIIDVATACGCEAPFRRDAALSTDTASSVDVALDALARVPGYDILVLLQPTSPLRTSQDIDGAIELLVSSGADACVSVRPATEHPYWTYRTDANDRLTAFASAEHAAPLRRQDLPAAWCLNGAVYAVHAAPFRAGRTFLPANTVGFPMPAQRSIDIDTLEDIEEMIALVQGQRDGQGHPG